MSITNKTYKYIVAYSFSGLPHSSVSEQSAFAHEWVLQMYIEWNKPYIKTVHIHKSVISFIQKSEIGQPNLWLFK